MARTCEPCKGDDGYGETCSYTHDWMHLQAHKCVDAIRSACCGNVPGTIHGIAIGAERHDLTMSFIYRKGPAKGIVLEHIDGSRLAVVFFDGDIWACYRVAIHEWAEHLMRINCCEPCITRESPCDLRHTVADLAAAHCLAEAQAVTATCSTLVPQHGKQGRRTRVAFSPAPAPI